MANVQRVKKIWRVTKFLTAPYVPSVRGANGVVTKSINWDNALPKIECNPKL
jgi:hypothetical protein